MVFCGNKSKITTVFLLEESTICVVTLSGVTSGGIVTSGMTCWTYVFFFFF